LKDLAATSDVAVIEAQKYYRRMEDKLAMTQRAGKKDGVKAIHARISARRKDFHHQLSTRLANQQLWGDLRRQRECAGIVANWHGEIRAGCLLESVPNHAAV
jgi:DNA-binding transcriptional regulator YhcF (GntR family)